MIVNDLELDRTRAQLIEVETALSDLKRQVYDLSRERFHLMSESYLSEIEMLRGRVDEYLGITAARELSSDFILKISSPLLAEGIAPVFVVNRAIAGLQTGLQKLGEFVVKANHGFGTNIPSHILAQEFDLEVVAVAPGSFEVGLRLSGRGRIDIPRESFGEATQILIDTAIHVSHREATSEFLTERLPDLSSQLQVLQALKDISPSSRRREITVSLQARFLGEQIVTFTVDTRKYLASLIRSRRREAMEVGIIREIDLDKRTFKLRTTTTTLRCKYTDWADERMANGLDRRARVSGVAQIAPDGKILSFSAQRLEFL
jgi:hypothetical protein